MTSPSEFPRDREVRATCTADHGLAKHHRDALPGTMASTSAVRAKAGTTWSSAIERVYEYVLDRESENRATPSNLTAMSEILDAVRAGASAEVLASIEMPLTTRAVFVRRDEQSMFDGMASVDKDPRRSLHVDEVPVPELAPDEVFIAVMASSINFNSVWTSIFEPLSTLDFLIDSRRSRSGDGVTRSTTTSLAPTPPASSFALDRR